MDVTVRLFAALRDRAGVSEITVEGLPDGIDMGALKREVERLHPRLGSLTQVAGVVGTSYVKSDHKLSAGDEVSFLPPVSGGSTPSVRRAEDAALEAGVFELSAGPLDPARAAERVRHPACGAIATFTGTTRDEHRGRRVVRLEYEAFEAMTGPEMARIFERCRRDLASREEFASEDGVRGLRMLCQHRTGTVLVGEPSVVIAVSSPHRALAFGACRFLIDALKETLPIWKKEVYEDGEAWIGARS